MIKFWKEFFKKETREEDEYEWDLFLAVSLTGVILLGLVVYHSISWVIK